MASRSKSDLHPHLVEVFDFAEGEFLRRHPEKSRVILTATFRSNEEQDKLFLQVPWVTSAKGGQSPHNFKPSFAFDIAFIAKNKKPDWNNTLFRLFADILKEKYQQTVRWGGDFESRMDRPHFELKGWKELSKKI